MSPSRHWIKLSITQIWSHLHPPPSICLVFPRAFHIYAHRVAGVSGKVRILWHGAQGILLAGPHLPLQHYLSLLTTWLSTLLSNRATWTLHGVTNAYMVICKECLWFFKKFSIWPNQRNCHACHPPSREPHSGLTPSTEIRKILSGLGSWTLTTWPLTPLSRILGTLVLLISNTSSVSLFITAFISTWCNVIYLFVYCVPSPWGYRWALFLIYCASSVPRTGLGE